MRAAEEIAADLNAVLSREQGARLRHVLRAQYGTLPEGDEIEDYLARALVDLERAGVNVHSAMWRARHRGLS